MSTPPADTSGKEGDAPCESRSDKRIPSSAGPKSSTPSAPADTSTAGEWTVEYIEGLAYLNTGDGIPLTYAPEAFAEKHNASLAALREQLAREQQAAIHIAATCLLAGAKGEDGSITSAVDELARKLTEAQAALGALVEWQKNHRLENIKHQAALKQKDEALAACISRFKGEGEKFVKAAYVIQQAKDALSKSSPTPPHSRQSLRPRQRN